jgi:long-subunit fatty acid transport protein
MKRFVEGEDRTQSTLFPERLDEYIAEYDTDPTQPEDRVPILPADEQWRVSGGFTYALKNDRKVGVSLTYLNLGDARIDQTTDVGRFAGDYDKNRVIFLSLNYAF